MMGSLFGGSLMVDACFARLMDLALYKMHELALHGPPKVALDTLSRLTTRRTRPHVKLHRGCASRRRAPHAFAGVGPR